MRKLIHPVTGLQREWPEPRGFDVREVVQALEGSAVQGAPMRTYPREFPSQTTARIEQHQIGLLSEPVRPDYARTVLQLALSGELNSQWELFSLMEGWDRLAKNLNEVKNAVKRLQWTVSPYAERGEEPSERAQEKADLVEAALKNWEPQKGGLEYSFEEFIYHALDAMGKGISVQEVHWYQRDGSILPRAAHLLTPRQYGWNREGTRLGLINQAGTQWQEFTDEQFVVGFWHARSGFPGATALLRSLVPYWVGATYGWRWLMQTAQLFGVPFRWANYDETQPGLANTVATMLENMGSSGWAAFPNGTTLEFKEAVTSARDNPQALILDLAKKACDLLVLGQELSSESSAAGLGSGTAMLQGKVRQDVLHNAAAWVADLMSYQLVRPLLLLNYGETSEAPEVCPDLSIDPDPKAKAERDEILIRAGVRIPASYMYDRHQIPEPQDGEEVVTPIGSSPLGPQAGAQDMGLPGMQQGDGDGADPETKAEEKPEDAVGAKARCCTHAPITASATDQLIDNVLEDLTGVQARWLGDVRPVFQKLILAAKDESLNDAEFVRTLEKAQKRFPELFDKLNMDALAEAIEASLGAAVVNGAVQGYLDRKKARRTPGGGTGPTTRGRR